VRAGGGAKRRGSGVPVKMNRGVNARQAAKEFGLGQIEDLAFPLVFQECAAEEERKWDGNQFRHGIVD
jgi:hypothetical protein